MAFEGNYFNKLNSNLENRDRHKQGKRYCTLVITYGEVRGEKGREIGNLVPARQSMEEARKD